MKYSKKKSNRNRKTYRKTRKVVGGGTTAAGVGASLAKNAAGSVFGAMVGLGRIGADYGASLTVRSSNYLARKALEKAAILKSKNCSFKNAYIHFIKMITYDTSNPENTYDNEDINKKNSVFIENNKDQLKQLYKPFFNNEFNETEIQIFNQIINDHYNAFNNGNYKLYGTNCNGYLYYLYGTQLKNSKPDQITKKNTEIKPIDNAINKCLYTTHYEYEFTLNPAAEQSCLTENEYVDINNPKNENNKKKYYKIDKSKEYKQFTKKTSCTLLSTTGNVGTIRKQGIPYKIYLQLMSHYSKFNVKYVHVLNDNPHFYLNNNFPIKVEDKGFIVVEFDPINDTIIKNIIPKIDIKTAIQHINNYYDSYNVKFKGEFQNKDNLKSIDDMYFHVYNDKKPTESYTRKFIKILEKLNPSDNNSAN